MKYLLDTPLLVELVRAKADEWSSRWIDAFNEEEICLSVLTIGEISRSIESEPDTKRKAHLRKWLEEELLLRFHGKIIPLDQHVITEWGRVMVEAEMAGKPLSAMDGLVAATVRVRGLVLITYNREVYSGVQMEVSDPWQG